jgi:hypothetical protein
MRVEGKARTYRLLQGLCGEWTGEVLISISISRSNRKSEGNLEEVERETGMAGIGREIERHDDSIGPVQPLPGHFPRRTDDACAGVHTHVDRTGIRFCHRFGIIA